MKRRTRVLAAAAVLAAVISGGVVVMSSSTPATPAAQQPAVSTATVERGKLSAMVSEDGTLTYSAQSDGSPYSVINQAQGTYTRLPAPGQVISQGQVIYRVNESPVVLLYGSVPAYRTLSAGSGGRDVAELNADLVALGYASPVQLSPASASFGPVTTTAVEKLQSALRMPPSGTLTLGQVVFEPAAVRVISLPAQLGGSTQTGQTVLQATSTTRQVQVALDAAQQTDMADGDKVTITLPDNRITPGVVSSVGTVATCPSGSGAGSGSAAPGTGTCSPGSSGSSAAPTITVDVTPSDPGATGSWDEAPVQVGITTASVSRALIVPVTALLARSSGGYAVEVADAGGIHHLVPVALGLFDDADGLVQVTGSGLAARQKVVVPST